ncbi:MAG: S-layer homology domain-containing protein, partial [Oscillospiraceae bacterium]|nr:S-layer homology domain-containing protein [Oscillospiraceae bacterium]
SRRDGWDKTINRIEYLLIRRKAQADEKLDTLYTTVFEPYNKTPYIKSIDRIDMVPANGESLGTDKAATVRVELVDGRIDYVMYATRNDILYTITDNTVGTETEGYTFSFKGFAGVWTVKSVDGNLENVYSYLNDGSIIGDNATEHTDSITGKVTWHTKGLSIVNKVAVEFDKPIDETLLNMLREDKTSLSGRLFVGETTAAGNAAFVIEDAEISEDGKTAVLSFGNVTIVDSYDSYEEDTYNYSLTEGVTRFTIPMSYEDDMSPIFAAMSKNLSATAGSSVNFNIVAESQLDDGVVTYEARTLPRGASLDERGAFMWKPTSSQVGENVVAVDAIDSLGRVSTIYFTITVQGSTTGGSSGGGGGATTTTPTEPETPEKTEEGTPEVPDIPEKTARFVDLGNHSWAEDAINALADEGIIKGTSETTFSPGDNITRADFAILLVRAFNLSSDNTENFSDVEATDYFAKELAIARNCGIINGIGDNKYAPRNTITRQDMMVIVYRAMQKLGVELKSGVVEYADFAEVADYAKEAVSALVTAELVNGKNGKIAPNDYTTRAEVAVLIKRILDYMK